MRQVVKRAVHVCCTVLLLPFWGLELIARASAKRDVFFATHSEYLSLFGGKIGSYLRVAYYARTMKQCDQDCYVGFGTLFAHSEAIVRKGTYIGIRCILGMVEIGDEVMLADGVQILSGKRQHAFESTSVSFQSQERQFQTVRVGRGSWLGANAIVMADIGERCVIGAGSVVTKPIPDCSVAVGNPARVIKTLASNA